jgi:nucleoside phosphorylase
MNDKADVAVLIALQEEYDYFTRVFPCTPDEDGQFWFEFDDASDSKRSAIVSVCDKMTNEVMRVQADRLLAKHQPSLLVVIGLAGMVASDTRLGETVVATEVHDYAFVSRIVDRVEGFDIHWGGRSFNPSTHLSDMALSLRTRHKKIFDEWKKSVLSYLDGLIEPAEREKLEKEGLLPPKYFLHVGQVANGNSVIISRNYKQKLLDTNRKLVAVEMESAGALAAAYDRARGPFTMVIRALSDPSDERKKAIDEIGGGDAIRQWAMYNAASLLKVFLEQLPVWPDTQATPRTRRTDDDLLADVHRLSYST